MSACHPRTHCVQPSQPRAYPHNATVAVIRHLFFVCFVTIAKADTPSSQPPVPRTACLVQCSPHRTPQSKKTSNFSRCEKQQKGAALCTHADISCQHARTQKQRQRTRQQTIYGQHLCMCCMKMLLQKRRCLDSSRWHAKVPPPQTNKQPAGSSYHSC